MLSAFSLLPLRIIEINDFVEIYNESDYYQLIMEGPSLFKRPEILVLIENNQKYESLN